MSTPLDPDSRRLGREEQIRRRYDRRGLVGALGRHGEAIAEVVDAAASLGPAQCLRLAEEWERVREDATASGQWDALVEVYACARPYPEHPGFLYAIDGWARNAFNYAGLVARERAHAASAPLMPVEFAAEGMVMALAMEASDEAGTFSPFPPELRPLMKQAWVNAGTRPLA